MFLSINLNQTSQGLILRNFEYNDNTFFFKYKKNTEEKNYFFLQ